MNNSTTFTVSASYELRKEVAKFCKELGLSWNKDIRGYCEVFANNAELIFNEGLPVQEPVAKVAKASVASVEKPKSIALSKSDPNFTEKLNFIRSTKALWFNNKINRWCKKKEFNIPSIKPTNEFEAQVLTYIASK
jgi:hypothetical protein